MKQQAIRRFAPLCMCVVVFVPACETGTPKGAKQFTSPTLGDSELRERAETLWQAKVAQDCATQFAFEDRTIAKASSLDEFVKWCENDDVFLVRDYSIESVEAEEDRGWVSVRYRTHIRGYENQPANEATNHQFWEVVDGEWMPLRRGREEEFPAAPRKRDREAERALRARFEAAWPLREALDWSALYAMSDPRDHEEVSEEEYAGAEDYFRYLGYEIDWVEVIGERGRIRVLYEHVLNDPSLTKMPTRSSYLIENWVLYGGQWYRDLVPN